MVFDALWNSASHLGLSSKELAQAGEQRCSAGLQPYGARPWGYNLDRTLNRRSHITG